MRRALRASCERRFGCGFVCRFGCGFDGAAEGFSIRFGRGFGVAHGKKHVEASSLTQRQSGLGYLVNGVALDQAVAVDAMDGAAARVEQAQVVVNLGSCGDRGARVAGGVLLLDGDGRSEAVNLVHVGLFDALQKLAGVGGE